MTRANELAETIGSDLSKPHLIVGKKSRAALAELVRLAADAERYKTALARVDSVCEALSDEDAALVRAEIEASA